MADTPVMRNHRNLYRLLHVQHDAPTAVIKNSYRTMMQTLRHHPDLGGDEWNAQLLNEAMETLCDPLSRARYDAAMAGEVRERYPHERASGASGRECGSSAPDPSGSGPSGSRDSGGDRWTSPEALPLRIDSAGPRCPFCDAPTAPARRRPIGGYPTRPSCVRCGAPTRSPDASARSAGATDRRGSHRVERATNGSLRRRTAPDERTDASLLEFSTLGCALETSAALEVGEVVLVHAGLLSAVARVRSSPPAGAGEPRRCGLEFLTLELHATPGDTFSGTA